MNENKRNKLWLIWRSDDPDNRRRYNIGDLWKGKDGRFYFKYGNEVDEAIHTGLKPFPGFDDLEKTYESQELFPNITSRLPNQERSEYLDILNSYNLDTEADAFTILKTTKGRLITDNFEFVPVFDRGRINFNVAGMRHYEKTIEKMRKNLQSNMKIILEPEPESPYDKNAIKVVIPFDGKRFHIGYVPRYYTEELVKIVNDDVRYSAMIDEIHFDAKNHDEKMSINVKLLLV